MTIPPQRAPGDVGHIGDHNDVAMELTSQKTDITAAQASIASHTTADDPHGDKAYANTTFSPLGHTHASAITSVNGKTGEVSLTAADVNAVSSGVVGLPNGVAALDANGKVPTGQLPAGSGSGTAVVTPRPALGVVYANGYPVSWRAGIDSLTFVCDGSSDQTEINAAITAVAAQGGGDVLLAGYQFNMSGPALVKTGIWLRGGGPMTELRATSGFNDAIVRTADVNAHMIVISDMHINGAGQNVHGVMLDNTNGLFGDKPTSSPDAGNVVERLFIRAPGSGSFAGHGIIVRGNNCRANKLSTIRVLDARGCGLWVDGAPDSHYTNIECGASGNSGPAASSSQSAPVGHGFFIRGGNSMFSNCKGWYSRGNGFEMISSRTQYANCQAQDNYGYGFLASGKVSLAGCHADSNGQAQGANGLGRAGFRFESSACTGSALESYDRGGQSWQQQYGFSFTSGCSYSLIHGVTYANAGGSVTGTPGTGTITQIIADSGGK